ncbi:hypothetical protein LJR056_002756 [Paenibacillus sp. LjRoot56]
MHRFAKKKPDCSGLLQGSTVIWSINRTVYDEFFIIFKAHIMAR